MPRRLRHDLFITRRARWPLRCRGYIESNGKGPVVLVVDDDESIRELVSDALRYDGYRVVTAADGAQGLAALVGLGACVVLLDMRMPMLDGWEFSRQYRAGPDT